MAAVNEPSPVRSPRMRFVYYLVPSEPVLQICVQRPYVGTNVQFVCDNTSNEIVKLHMKRSWVLLRDSHIVKCK